MPLFRSRQQQPDYRNSPNWYRMQFQLASLEEQTGQVDQAREHIDELLAVAEETMTRLPGQKPLEARLLRFLGEIVIPAGQVIQLSVTDPTAEGYQRYQEILARPDRKPRVDLQLAFLNAGRSAQGLPSPDGQDAGEVALEFLERALLFSYGIEPKTSAIMAAEGNSALRALGQNEQYRQRIYETLQHHGAVTRLPNPGSAFATPAQPTPTQSRPLTRTAAVADLTATSTLGA